MSHYAECHYVECHKVFMPSVVAPYETYLGGADTLTNLPEFGKSEKSCIGKKYKLKCWWALVRKKKVLYVNPKWNDVFNKAAGNIKVTHLEVIIELGPYSQHFIFFAT